MPPVVDIVVGGIQWEAAKPKVPKAKKEQSTLPAACSNHHKCFKYVIKATFSHYHCTLRGKSFQILTYKIRQKRGKVHTILQLSNPFTRLTSLASKRIYACQRDF